MNMILWLLDPKDVMVVGSQNTKARIMHLPEICSAEMKVRILVIIITKCYILHIFIIMSKIILIPLIGIH